MVVVAAPVGIARRVWQWKWRVFIVLFVVGLTALTLYLTSSRSQQQIPAPTSASAKTVIAQAWAVPTQQRKLAFKTTGLIKAVTVSVGDKVKTGDAVATIDTSDLQLKVDDAQANLDLQKALVAQSADPPPATDVAAARAALDSAITHQKDVEGGASPGDLQAAREAVAQAQAVVDNSLALERKATAPATVSDIAAAQASVRSAQADLASAQQKLNDLKSLPKPADVATATLAVDQAKNTLWAQQVNRDATCGTFGSNSTQCHSADASVAAQETAVKSAQGGLLKAQQPATADELNSAAKAVASAESANASTVAHLAQVKAGPAANDRDAAKSQVDQSQASLRAAQAKLDQLQRGSTATDLEAARSAVGQARAALAKLTADPSQATVDVSKAKLKQAQVTLAEARQTLDSATIQAPFDGVVTSIALKSGDVATPGTTVLTVADLTSLRFETKDLDEVSAAKVQVGQAVQVTVPALDKKTFAGTVTSVDQEPTVSQSGDVNYVARITLQETPASLEWGQSARIEFK